MYIDYDKIGQRIRTRRKAFHLTQEELAERVGISTIHMSHIETGNTKLGLSVLVNLANALSVQTDELLFDSPQANNTDHLKQEINGLLDTCSVQELYALKDLIIAVKDSLDKHYTSSNEDGQ